MIIVSTNVSEGFTMLNHIFRRISDSDCTQIIEDTCRDFDKTSKTFVFHQSPGFGYLPVIVAFKARNSFAVLDFAFLPLSSSQLSPAEKLNGPQSPPPPQSYQTMFDKNAFYKRLYLHAIRLLSKLGWLTSELYNIKRINYLLTKEK